MQGKLNAGTQAHINEVQRLIHIVVAHMLKRAEQHDKSKFSEEEAKVFDEYSDKLKGVTYGSPEYQSYLEAMQPALEHHYAMNSHHPEHFEDGVNGMTLFDLLEMFVDWYAATKRHEDGSIWKSIKTNEERFKLSPQLVSILHNTAITLIHDMDHTCGNCEFRMNVDGIGGECSVGSTKVRNEDGEDCTDFKIR